MKPLATLLSTSLVVLPLIPAAAATFTDTNGDFTGGSGFLDITSVDVNNTASVLTLRINVAADPSAAANNWGTRLIGFDTAGPGAGNINATGGWGKDIQVSTGGMNFFIGSWVNNPSGNPAGATLYSWDGTAWTTLASTSGENPFNLNASVDTTGLTLSMDYAALGLSAGDSFNFDVYSSTTGGDNVLDALGSDTSMTWNSAPYDSGLNVESYTIAVIPEPSSLVLLVTGMLAVFRRGARNAGTGM